MRRFAIGLLAALFVFFTATPAGACSIPLDPLSIGPVAGASGTPIQVRAYCPNGGQVFLRLAGAQYASQNPIDSAPVSGDGLTTVTLYNKYAPPLGGGRYMFEMEVTLVCGSGVVSVPFLATEQSTDSFGRVYTVPGDGQVNVRAFDAAGAASRSVNFYSRVGGRGGTIAAMTPFESGYPNTVTGSGPGADGTFSWFGAVYGAYPGFPGGVNVATGDLDGDGVDEIVTGAGPGGGPHVRVFRRTAGNPSIPDCYPRLAEAAGFMAYDTLFAGGVNVAVADVDNDGKAEIITGAGAGGRPHVRVFDERGRVKGEFMAYDPAFRGGVNVAAADLMGDDSADIVTGAGPGGGPHVRVFDRKGKALAGFYAYAPSFIGGVFVAAGHAIDASVTSIVTGAGPRGGPHVRVLTALGTELGGFYAYQNLSAGVRVAVAP